jgi:uncharacterized protein with PIN domain
MMVIATSALVASVFAEPEGNNFAQTDIESAAAGCP